MALVDTIIKNCKSLFACYTYSYQNHISRAIRRDVGDSSMGKSTWSIK